MATDNPFKQITTNDLEEWMKAMFNWRAPKHVVTVDVQSMHHDGAPPFREDTYLRVNVVLRAEPKQETPAADTREMPTPGTPDTDPLLPNPDEPEKLASVIEDLEL